MHKTHEIQDALSRLSNSVKAAILKDVPSIQRQAEITPLIDDAITVVGAFFMNIHHIADALAQISDNTHPDAGK